MKYAITGGIGSGKTFISNILRQYGIEVYDCDAAAKRLMSKSDKIKHELRAIVGDELYNEYGTMNKDVMRKFVLQSDQNRKRVSEVVHPAVGLDFMLSGCDVMECAILYESGLNIYVDKVICIAADGDIRQRRVMERNGVDAQQAQKWMDAQMKQEELKKRADIIFYNDPEHSHDFQRQISNLIKLLSNN